ncbi:hypothetical protein J0664_05865 [Rhizobium leguminosarum]|nr:hypothetical protein [Rhizobium leguminosarum]MBY5553764.1 hypothetical protein [Rhizobium leguminosarum]QSW24825.1 hypothetical protein J0664_05865 [Rhizobium leguminosarum]
MRKTFHLAWVVIALVGAAYSTFTGNDAGAAALIGLAILSKLCASEAA